MASTSITKLLKVMRQLRDPKDGCEWDKLQTHESLIPFLKEESQEVIEAIRKNDPENLKEELGDLLLQIIFHSQIAEENEFFKFDDVVKSISEKLIRRHPYVFDQKQEHTAEQQAAMWKEIKEKEKNGKC